MKPRDSMPSTSYTRPRNGAMSPSLEEWKASASASSGVMSRNRMSGFGKSGMSRMWRRRSLMVSRFSAERSGLAPAVGAAQLHEAAIAEVLLGQGLWTAAQEDERLDILLSHGEHDASAERQLLEQGTRDLRRAGGDDDPVV